MFDPQFKAKESKEIEADHNNTNQIEDVAYDYYSERKATYCSSYQYVKVWNKTTEGKWIPTSNLENHSSTIWKVTWAHPQYGQVLAICSSDGTAAVWEEIVGDTLSGSDKSDTRHWVQRKNICDFKNSVTDVKFCPQSQGLQLATCSTEGFIKIYEVRDTNKLSQWTLKHEIQCQLSLSCLDWSCSLSKLDSPLIAVGSNATDAEAVGKVLIYEYNENSRKWVKLVAINSITEPVHEVAFAPNLERSFHILGVATNKDVKSLNLKPVEKQSVKSNASRLDIQTASEFEHNGFPIQRLSWKVSGEVLVSIGDDASVRMLNSSTGRADLCVLPNDEDDACHIAFYYAIRSGNIKLVDSLINRWPEKKSVASDKLDEILSRAYAELKLKNVLLTEEMELFVENKLIDIRFFSNSSENDRNALNNLNNIKKRIKLVTENIRLLNEEYSGVKKVDEKFLFIARFIVKNINILKRQLKSTYARLPWEEIEFCLIGFIFSYTQQIEMNIFYRSRLSKTKILYHLQNFGKKLDDELNSIIEGVNIDKLGDLPKFKREEVVMEIIYKHPRFSCLYNDYQKIRDIYSLEKIRDSIMLALLADPKKIKEQFIITRALQITGEFLKNTLESPNLSNNTSELLLLSLPKNTRKIITDLRNSLSHAYSLVKRTEIEENGDDSFFTGVQNDIKKIYNVINDILYNNKIKTIRTLQTIIGDSESPEVIREVADLLKKVKLKENISSDIKMTEHDKLKKLIKNLSDIIIDKTNYEKQLFNKIDITINCDGTKSKNIRFDYIVGLAMLKSLNTFCSANRLDHNAIKNIKFAYNLRLNDLPPKIEPSKLKEVAELSMKLVDSAKLRTHRIHVDEVDRLLCEIFIIVESGTDDIRFIMKLQSKLHKESSTSKKTKGNKLPVDKYNNYLELKLFELKNILSNSLSDKSTETLSFYKNDKKLQAVIEMLVLDTMSILSSSSRMENNLLFLDDNAPLLHGKCLRDYLAHDNALVDIFLSDPSISVMLNAIKLVSENLISTKKKVGKFVKDDPSKVKDKYDQDLITITNQQILFDALEKGNLTDLKSYFKKGADIQARSINSWTTLHFAAKGASLEIVKLILEQKVSPVIKDTNGQSPLHVAAAYGRKELVEFFVKELGLYVDDVDHTGKTPLHIAAQNGFKDVVKVLLENKANNVLQDRAGLSPLYYAIGNHHVEIAKILMARDANVDINETMGGYTSLHAAAENDQLELVNFLLQNKADVNARNDRNWTPLHAAALNGHVEVLNALILAGANVNSTVINGCTPLHYALEDGHEEIANILLNHGANVNAVDKTYNNTPLHYATQDGHEKIVKTLLKNNAQANLATLEGITPIHFAAQNNYLSIVTVLLNYGVNIHAKDKNGSTPLHYAAKSGNKEVVELLIRRGAKVNAKCNNDETPLHLAAQNGRKDVIDLLIKNNADVKARDIYGDTPLHSAAVYGSKDIIGSLLKNNADVNTKSNECITPLHIAAYNGDVEVTKFLLKKKAEVNPKANYLNCIDVTPLHCAVLGGHKGIINLLLENNAQINAGSAFGTPLCTAVEVSDKESIELLLANGADVNAGDDKPLSLAVTGGNWDIVQILLKNKASVHTKLSDNMTPLHLAAFEGHKEIVRGLIKEGAEINTRHITPLYLAVQEGYIDVVKTLINNGANVNIVDEETSPPLHIAAGQGHDDIVKILLNNGATINQKNTQNITALELAVAQGHLQVVKILLQDNQRDVKAKGFHDWTLLHIASQGSNQDSNLIMVKYLVNKGFDIKAKNESGLKPIHIAAREGHVDTIEFFLSNGLSVNEPGAYNQTLLFYAVVGGHLEVVNYLIAQGADVNAQDTNYSTPMHMAASCGYTDIIKVLLENGAVYDAVDKFYKRPINKAKDANVVNLLVPIEKLFEAVRRDSTSEVEKFITSETLVNVNNADIGALIHYAAWKGHERIVTILLKNKANPNAIGKKGLNPLHYAAEFSHLNIVKTLLSNGAIYNAASDDGKTPSDLAKDKSIINLLKLVSESFRSIKNGGSKVVKDLNKIKNIDTVKAVMNACDRQNRTLVVAAVHSQFSKLEELKQISQGDLSVHIDLAIELLYKSDYQRALIIFQTAFEKRKEILGPDNPGTLDIQSYIAQVLYKQGVYQEALTILENVFTKRERMLGSNNKDTLNTRSTMALVLHRQGKDDEAYNIFLKVYQEQNKILGPNHSDTITTQFHMALVLNNQGRYEEALIINKEVFEKRKKTLGIHNPVTIAAQNNIAMVLISQGKYEEGLKSYKEVYEKKKNILGTYHADTMRTSHDIAGILFVQKKYQEALKEFQKILNTQKEVLGLNHPDVLDTRYHVANVLFKQGKWISALTAYRECYDPCKAVYGPSHPIVLGILNKFEIIDNIFKLKGKETSQIIQYLQKDINIAASNGDIETVQTLLEHGNADVNDKDIDGRTPLHYAVSKGHMDVVNTLLKNGADATQVTNKGNTPLHTAASNGYKEIIEVLLQHVNRGNLTKFINAKTISSESSSLHIAAKNGFLEVVKSLLKHGATYNIDNKKKEKPLDVSGDQNITDLLKLVKELFEDAKQGNVEIINKLGALLSDEFLAVTNARNSTGNTILQVAITNKHKTIASKLLQNLKTGER